MAGWKGEEDTVDNQVSPLNIVTIVTSIYGRSLPSRALSAGLCSVSRSLTRRLLCQQRKQVSDRGMHLLQKRHPQYLHSCVGHIFSRC